MRTLQCLECLAETRELVGETPIVPMTYAAILEAYGWERFATDAAARGATSLIVSDLPAGQRTELRRVHLVAPTSTDERISLAASTTDGWLYLVTVTGTTGARAELSSALEGLVARVRPLAGRLPLYAGFGISTPEQAAAAASLADGDRRRLARGAGRRGRAGRAARLRGEPPSGAGRTAGVRLKSDTRSSVTRCVHYGWVMLGATLVVLVTMAGFRSTVGILVDPLRDEFGWTTASISLAAGLNLLLYGFGGPFAAALYDRFGLRRCVVTAVSVVALGSLATLAA